MKNNNMNLVKTLINYRAHGLRTGHLFNTVYLPLWEVYGQGYLPMEDTEGHLIGLRREVWDRDEDDELVLVEQEDILFNRQERHLLKLAGF